MESALIYQNLIPWFSSVGMPVEKYFEVVVAIIAVAAKSSILHLVMKHTPFIIKKRCNK